MVDLTNTNDPDTGDIYSGFDRFGRVKDNRWYNYDALADVDRIQYGYNRAGNRIWRKNVVADALGKHFDELYGNDAIQRLKDLQRGTLNGSQTGVTDETYAECWSLDQTGNWQKYLQDDDGSGWDLNQSRTANTVNEITDISASTGPTWVTPVYSKAGNMTTMPKPADPTASFTATYDAWNRLVKLVDDTTTHTIATYQYDGAKRRVVEQTYSDGTLEETRHCYFTEPSKWQVIEERLDSSTEAKQQFVWGLRYIDDILMRDRDTNGNGTLDERLFGLQDANWNVTCLIEVDGTAVERFAYSAYGNTIFLSPLFITNNTSIYEWQQLYTGQCISRFTLLLNARKRQYSTQTGQWLQRDPLSYIDGLSLYANYFTLNGTDPLGTEMSKNECEQLAKNVFNQPVLKNMIDKIKEKCGIKLPEITCSLDRSGGVLGGKYTSGSSEIVIYYGDEIDSDNFVSTVMHELVHMFDFCDKDTETHNPTCWESLCGEARAFSCSGDGRKLKGKSKQNYVFQKLIAYLRMPPCKQHGVDAADIALHVVKTEGCVCEGDCFNNLPQFPDIPKQ